MNYTNHTHQAQTVSSHFSTIFLIVLCLTGGFLYFETLSHLAGSLFTYDGSYGLLIFSISIYMILKKGRKLKNLKQQPNFLWGSGITLAGCFFLLVGRLTTTLLIQNMSFIVVLLGLILLVFGFRHFRALLIPICYLCLMFPLFQELLGNVSIHLQHVAAWIGSRLLSVTGMPVYLNGRIIDLPHITLEVTKACSGIHHIVALVAMAIPLAIMTPSRWLKTWPRKAAFVLSSFLVWILINGLRVALIGIWTVNHKGADLHGPFDIFYVSFITFFGIILYLVTVFISRKFPVETSGLRENDVREKTDFRKTFSLQFYPMSVGLIILLLTVAWLYLLKPLPADLMTPLETFPRMIDGWTGEDISMKDWPFRHAEADVQLKRIYRHPSKHEIGIYIGYFPLQQQDREIINSRFDWLHNNASLVSIHDGSNSIHIKKAKAHSLHNSRVLYFWYDVNGKIYVDRYRTKIGILREALLAQRRNGAIIVIMLKDLPNRGKHEPDTWHRKFIQEVFPIIHAYLKTS